MAKECLRYWVMGRNIQLEIDFLYLVHLHTCFSLVPEQVFLIGLQSCLLLKSRLLGGYEGSPLDSHANGVFLYAGDGFWGDDPSIRGWDLSMPSFSESCSRPSTIAALFLEPSWRLSTCWHPNFVESSCFCPPFLCSPHLWPIWRSRLTWLPAPHGRHSRRLLFGCGVARPWRGRELLPCGAPSPRSTAREKGIWMTVRRYSTANVSLGCIFLGVGWAWG